MDSMFKKIISVVMLVSTNIAFSGGNVLPYLALRSPARNTVRKIVGTTSHHINLYDMESFYGTFSITPEYDQTFRRRHLRECLFGSFIDDDGDVTVSGSQVANRGTNDWTADNFYLPRDFQSKINFKPRVQNFIVDFHLYTALDEWAKGLYFRIYGPVVHTRHNLKFNESCDIEGTEGYAAGCFATTEVTADNLLKNAEEFFCGKALSLDDVTTQELKFAKMKPGKQKETCFGDLRFEFGWNFLLEEDYHFGLNIQAAAPTGRRPKAEFLFEPQCGNGKHWELGGGVTSHWTWWRSEDEEKHFDFIIEADITHMFKARQTRTFDLKGKPLSRYMLAQKLGSIDENNNPRLDIGSVEFKSEYAPVANFSTFEVKVSSGVQADVVAMFNFTSRGWSLDGGYNLWVRSCEKISLRDEDCFSENTWALKGDAYVFGRDTFNEGDFSTVPLAATQSQATISSALNTVIANPLTNPSIDSPTAAKDNNENNLFVISIEEDTNINTSENPVFIKGGEEGDFDFDGARSKGLSHKVFGHIGYTWVDRENWVPYLGVGASAEFGSNDSRDRDKDCDTDGSVCGKDSSCLRCSASQWGVWLKGGISFD